MLKKTVMITAAAMLVLSVAVFAIGSAGQEGTCDSKIKTTSTACTKTASAAKVSATAGTESTCASACASSSKCCKGQACECAKKTRQAYYSSVKEVADDIPYRENTRLVVTGTYTCGMCDLGTTKTCVAFIKTTDGKTYPLVKSCGMKGMCKSKSKDLEITGRVKKEGGVKFLDVTSYKAI